MKRRRALVGFFPLFPTTIEFILIHNETFHIFHQCPFLNSLTRTKNVGMSVFGGTSARFPHRERRLGFTVWTRFE